MSTEHTDAGVHDHATEVRHAWAHFRENFWFFVAFLTLILLAVLNFEVSPANNYWAILGLGALRFGLIGFFMFSLVRPFSFIIAAFLFTILFFGGMIFLSLWDSTITNYIGDPIQLPAKMQQH
jgi:hypothetical protein